MIRGPLNGVRVLELGMMFAGPFGGKILADLGAEVIHVEDPQKGDPARHWKPAVDGMSVGFARISALKKSLALDLRNSEGQQIVRDLVPSMDVVLTNLRVAALERWGIGPDALRAIKPDLVVSVVSGFGATGPNSHKPGFGTVADGLSGFAFTNGWPDTPPTTAPFGLADCMAAITAALGIVASLRGRDHGIDAGMIDVAIYEPMLSIMGDEVARCSADGTFRGRQGNAVQSSSPRGVFHTRDDHWVVISGSSQNACTRLFGAIGHPEYIDDPRYSTNAARVEHDDDLMKTIGDWVAIHDRGEAIKLLDEADVPVAPVNSPQDIIDDKNLWERGSLSKLQITKDREVVVPSRYVRLTGQQDFDYPQPPALGQHTRDILSGDLGLDDATLERLERSGCIKLRPGPDAGPG
jgi:crotonobetainyl-CoA:carnitine CoA-transferase CaiB-like acyl-CoA transferase